MSAVCFFFIFFFVLSVNDAGLSELHNLVGSRWKSCCDFTVLVVRLRGRVDEVGVGRVTVVSKTNSTKSLLGSS